MKRGRLAKWCLALAVVTVIVGVPGVLYAASFPAAQARTAYFIDAGTAGTTKDWHSILLVLNPNAFTVGVQVTYYGQTGAAGWTYGFAYPSMAQLAVCGPVTIAANTNLRFHTTAILAAAGSMYQGHILLQTTQWDHEVVIDGWIYHPGDYLSGGQFVTGRDGMPAMRGGFHQEWVLDDWEMPEEP